MERLVNIKKISIYKLFTSFSQNLTNYLQASPRTFFGGQKSLKEELTSGLFVDITKSLDDFLAKKFPILNNPIMDDWNKRFQSLIRSMLDVAPENRPKASEVWEKTKEMVESLGAKPHCEDVSPVGSIPWEHEEQEDDTELHLRENLAKLMVKE